MNISPHTRVRHLFEKKKGNEGYVVRDIKMHEESRQICFPVPSLQSLMLHQLTSLVCNRRTACEYPILSCDVVSVEMCVRRR